jgi:hypothetical protein
VSAGPRKELAGDHAGDGVFDAGAAAGAVRRARLDRLFDPLAVAPHAHEVTASYRRAMEGGARFPPIAVVRVLGRDWVADGHKRLAAARELLPEGAIVPVEVWGLRRWSADQLRQARREAAKAARLPGLLVREPRRGLHLLLASPRHWWRVARSLAGHWRALWRRRARRAV